MNIHFHLYNEVDSVDDKVSVIIDMPFVPMVGDIIHLTHKQDKELIGKIKMLNKVWKDIYSHYKHKTGYAVEDCIFVVSRFYRVQDQSIHIELYYDEKIIDYKPELA